MQLRLIRFDLLILLLVSLIHVGASKRVSRIAALTANPIAMPFQQVSSWANDEKEGPESRGTQRRHDTRRGPGVGKAMSNIIISSPSHSPTLLAEKLAQDALHSKEMQDTFKELTSFNDDRKKQAEISKETGKVFQPAATSHTSSRSGNVPKSPTKIKRHRKHHGHGKRKHNKNKNTGRQHRHPKHNLKRHFLKKESSKTARERKSRKSVGRGRRRGLEGKCNSEESVTCRRKGNDQVWKTGKKLAQTPGENLRPFVNDEENFIGELPNFESTHKKYRRIPISEQDKKEGDVIHEKRSHMIAQLMLTTTADPTKKKLGDQGVEYSEYYSDNDNILSPDIRDQAKLDEVPDTLIEAQIRSVREAADENLFDQHYYDLSNDQLIEGDDERSKRNDQKFVKVMEEPSNSMEYVDNTYGPVPADGVVANEKIPQYPNNYNYIPDQGSPIKGDAYHVLNNPLAQVGEIKQPTPNQISPVAQAIFNQNLPVIENLSNKVPSNMNPWLPIPMNANPMMNNAQSMTPGQSPLPGNVILSQLSQPRVGDDNFQYYSIKETPLQHSTISMTSPVAFPMSGSTGKTINSLGDLNGNIPENEELSRLYAATSLATSSSIPRFNPTPSYDNFEGIDRSLELATPDKGTSVVPASPEASLATFTISSSPTYIISPSVNPSELLSGLREIRPGLGAPEVRYFNYNNGAENTRGSDQIELIAARETAMEGKTGKKGKKKGSNVTKKDEQTTTTVSEMNDVKKHDASKAAKGEDSKSSTTTSSQVSVTLGSSASEPANTTLIANETKAVANEILNEIIDELEELRLENPKNEQREGLPCRLTGSWVTARAGVRIDMQVSNHSIGVSLDHLTPPITTEGLLNVTWNVTGFAPFKRGGPFTLLATNNHTKTLAVFVGACKVCQGVDTIEGSWTVSREPRDCRDFQMSTDIFNEIFRRTRLYAAIKDKQSKHETETSSTLLTTSGNSSTSESTNAVHEATNHLRKFHNQSLELDGTE